MAALASNLVQQSMIFSRQNMESTDGSVSMDSSDHMDSRDSPNINNDSCCSDDTVLSVGNENPVPSPASSSEPLSFKNIESHLNAISKITNSTLNRDFVRSPSSPLNISLSPSSTKSIPKYCFKSVECDKSNNSDMLREELSSPRSVSSPEMPDRSPRYHENSFFIQNPNRDTLNNDASNSNLKFSIDNILKADFGRRITDPLNIRKNKPKKIVAETREETSKGTGPVDLRKTEEKEKKEGSQPLLWPAWVYCTRYSDRPSSGKLK